MQKMNSARKKKKKNLTSIVDSIARYQYKTHVCVSKYKKKCRKRMKIIFEIAFPCTYPLLVTLRNLRQVPNKYVTCLL